MICSTRCGAWGLSSSSFMPIWGLGMRGMGLPQSLCCDFHQLLLRWLAEVSCLLRLDPRSEAPVPSALRFPQQPWRGQASLTKTPPMVALLCSEIPIPQSRQNSRLLSLWQKKKKTGQLVSFQINLTQYLFSSYCLGSGLTEVCIDDQEEK